MKLVCKVLVILRTPETRWVKVSTLSIPVGDFPIGKLAHGMSWLTRTTNPRTSNSDAHMRYFLATSPLFSLYRESHDHDFTGCNFFTRENPECRIPTFRDLLPPAPIVIDGSNDFGKSPITISISMKLSPPQTPNTES
jgi:hypothetical protein